MPEDKRVFPKNELDIIFDSIPAIIFYKNTENCYIRVNEALAKALGTTKDRLEGKSMFELYPRELAEHYWNDDKEVICSGNAKRDIIEQMETPEGTRWVKTDKIPLRDGKGSIIGIIGFAIDITEQKKMQERLTEDEIKYRALYESSSDAVMMLIPGEGFFSGNPATVKLFGCKDEAEFITKSPVDLSPEYQPDGSSSMMKAQQMMAVAMEKGSNYFEWVHKRVDGKEFSASILLTRVEIKDKKFLQATVRDITSVKETGERLRQVAQEWDRTFNSISDMIFIIDKDHSFKRVNRAACEVLKMREEELVGKKCYEILHKRNEPWPLCPMEQTNQDNMPHAEEVDDPVIGVPLLVSTSPIFDEAGQYVGVVHVAKDISERKRNEQELINKINALERFQRITVDRELRMKELKEKIKELENKISQIGTR